jgi:lysophospholipase L1-like esterase
MSPDRDIGVSLLVVNGGDETAGVGLDDPNRSAWPAVLATALGADLVNLAQAAGSNRRILRTTVSSLPTLLQQRRAQPAETLVVSMWTNIDRYEAMTTPRLGSLVGRGAPEGRHWRPITRERAEAGDHRSQAWYRLYRSLYGASELYLSAVLLEHWLLDEGYRVLNTAAADLTAGVDDPFTEYRIQMHDAHYVGGTAHWLQTSLAGVARALDDLTPAGWPGARAHSAFALERVLPWLAAHREPYVPPDAPAPPPGRPIRLLVANGDSNTWGSELSRPAVSNWAAVLADRLGVEVVNLAEQGGSNHRILRTTVEHLGRLVAAHRLEPADVLYVGMWTLRDRMEVVGDTPELSMVHVAGFRDRPWQRIRALLIDRDHEPSVLWFRDLCERQTGVVDLLLSTILLDRWLARFGCRYALALAYDELGERLAARHPKLTSQLRPGVLVGGRGWSDAAMRMVVEGRAPIGPDGHPLEAGHRLYVDEVLLPWLIDAGIVGPTAEPRRGVDLAR